MRDDPIIHSLEQTGLPPWDDGSAPVCPICGSECSIVYKDVTGEILGCDECLTPCDAYEEGACYAEV